MMKFVFLFSLILVLRVSDSLCQENNTVALNDEIEPSNSSAEVQELRQSRYPNSCAQATAESKRDGIYPIQVDLYGPNPFLVNCDATTQGGGWTVIQRRLDGSVNFYRNWADYKAGFGNLAGEFFIGLDKLYAITTDTPQELLITMSDWRGVNVYAKYDIFAIGNENEKYALNVLGAYSGTAGDAFSGHASYKFSTYDSQNDVNGAYSCAVMFKGAWWYSNCLTSNLNGLYLRPEDDKKAQGIDWIYASGQGYVLKTVNMLIRPKVY